MDSILPVQPYIDLIRGQIQKYRKNRGLSQANMAEKMHISNRHYRSLESGDKGFTPDTFIDIANALNISADLLLVDCLTALHLDIEVEIKDILADCSQEEVYILLHSIRTIKEILHKFTIK